MPAARYWRAVGLQSVGAGALELSAFHLYLAGSRVDAAATLTCTVPPAPGAVANLQDDDTATVCRWLDVSAPGFALVWDFGAGNAQDVRAVRLGAGALHAEFLETLTLQHSSDGVAWTTLWSVKAFTWAGANTMQAVPLDGDPDFYKVSLLLHFDGANGSTVFTDSSSVPKAVTAYGNAKIDTTPGAWGGASLKLGGGVDALAVASSSSLQFGSADFTIEFRLRTTKAIQTRDYPRILSVGAYLENGAWNLVYLKSTGAVFLDFYASGVTALSMDCGTVADDTWLRFALTRTGGVVRSFIDGVLTNSASSSVVLNSTSGVVIGSERNMTISNFVGHIGELRVTTGLARYTDSFAPPSGPFPDAAGIGVATPPAPRGVAQAPAIVLSGGTSAPAGPVLAPAAITRDMQDSGGFRIYGTTELDADPTDVPVRRRVQLYNQRDGRLVRETWSDAATGTYRFDHIRGGDGTRYFVVAFDHTGDKRAVVADNLVPEVLP